MRTFPSKFDALNQAGAKSRTALVQIQDELVYAEERLQADWQANTEELQVDYTTVPVTGEVTLYRSSGSWSELSPTGTLPGVRAYATAGKYNGKMYLFGGAYSSGYYNDVWELALTTRAWTQKSPTGTPPSARTGHASFIYNGKLYVIGGYDGSLKNDVWELDLSTFVWTQKSPTGGPPAARYNHTCIEYNGKVYLFGGENDTPVTPTYYNDVWELDLSTFAWTQKSPTGTPPAARTQHISVEDNGKMYIHGGVDQTYTIVSDFWELDLSTFAWLQVSPSGSVPSARSYHSAVTYRRKLVIFGGNSPKNDVWKYDFLTGTWEQETSGATTRYGHVAIIDDADKMLMFGGYDGTATYKNDLWGDDNLFYRPSGFLLTDVMDVGQVPTVPGEWQIGDAKPTGTALAYRAWTADSTTFDTWQDWETDYKPQARRYATLVTNGTKLYLFGGEDASFNRYNDVWEFDTTTKKWTLITTSGTAPSARYNHAACVDSGVMYIYGGSDGSSKNDLFALNLTTFAWSSLTAGGTATQRHSLVPYNGYLYAFGGTGPLNTVWEYSISGDSWTSKSTTGGPPTARYAHTAVESGGKMYVHGGKSGSGYLSDTWELDLSSFAWTQKASASVSRQDHCAVVYSGKMYIHAGDHSTALKDSWEYDIAGNSWTQKMDSDDWLTRGAGALYGDTLYIFGGQIVATVTDQLISYGTLGGSATDLGTFVDGDEITTLKRYYMVRASFTANTDSDETSTLQSIRADFSTYLDVVPHASPGKISGLKSISTLSTSIDDFDDSTISAMTITLPFAARISKWMAEREPKNRIVKVKYGFIDPTFTDDDYVDAFYGQIDTWDIDSGNGVKLTVKSFHKEWKVQIPESWQSTGDDKTWTGIHPVDVMLDIIQNYLDYRDSKIDYSSFYTVRDALPGWKVTRTITNDPVESKELLNELRKLITCYFILKEDGKISLIQWDSTATAVATFTDVELKNHRWDANGKSLINKYFTYYDYSGTTGDEAADFNELDPGVRSTSITNWQEKGYKIVKDKWTDVNEAAQVTVRREIILDRYENPASIITANLPAKWYALELGDIVNITTKYYPSTDFTGCTDKPFQIIKLTPNWLKSEIKLTLLEV